jgi:hypothetical protein
MVLIQRNVTVHGLADFSDAKLGDMRYRTEFGNEVQTRSKLITQKLYDPSEKDRARHHCHH